MSLFRNRFTIQERRRKSIVIEQARKNQVGSLDTKQEFEKELQRVHLESCKEVYHNHKLTHNGVVTYKVFEGYYRKHNRNSLANLLNYKVEDDNQWRDGKPFDESFGVAVKNEKDYRSLSAAQVRACRKMCNKLAYYSGSRKFFSKKSGAYSMKVAFITLTFPSTCSESQALKAFDHFLDYLRRTANCVFVWKKELGDEGHQLHFHIMVNNFIPYYIVAWKWKRLLINEGVVWPLNKKGEETNSHTRIELPRKRNVIASYISKYIAKGCELPKEFGYIWGCSEILKQLKETVVIEGDVDNNELWGIIKRYKSISTDYVSIICCDLLQVRKIAPMLYSIFLKQYYAFRDALTLPQRFQYV